MNWDDGSTYNNTFGIYKNLWSARRKKKATSFINFCTGLFWGTSSNFSQKIFSSSKRKNITHAISKPLHKEETKIMKKCRRCGRTDVEVREWNCATMYFCCCCRTERRQLQVRPARRRSGALQHYPLQASQPRGVSMVASGRVLGGRAATQHVRWANKVRWMFFVPPKYTIRYF